MSTPTIPAASNTPETGDATSALTVTKKHPAPGAVTEKHINYSRLGDALIQVGKDEDIKEAQALLGKFLAKLKEKKGEREMTLFLHRFANTPPAQFKFNGYERAILKETIRITLPYPKEERSRRAFNAGLLALGCSALGISGSAARYAVMPRTWAGHLPTDDQKAIEIIHDTASGKLPPPPPIPTGEECVRAGIGAFLGIGSTITFGVAFKSLADAYFLAASGYTTMERFQHARGELTADEAIRKLYTVANAELLTQTQQIVEKPAVTV